MGVEENKKAVLDLYELLQAKPYPTDKIVALFAPTVVSKRIETGTFEGSREDFAQFFKGLMTETFPDAKFTNRRIIGDGDQVWIWALCEDIGPTRESVDVFTFNKEGLITEKYDIQQPGEYKF